MFAFLSFREIDKLRVIYCPSYKKSSTFSTIFYIFLRGMDPLLKMRRNEQKMMSGRPVFSVKNDRKEAEKFKNGPFSPFFAEFSLFSAAKSNGPEKHLSATINRRKNT